MRTPRTVAEAHEHDLDMPDTFYCVRRYSKGSRSADWRADDIRIMKVVGVLAVAAAMLVMWLVK